MCWEAWMISNVVEGCFIVVTDILCLAPLGGESTDRLSRFWSANLGAETSPLYKWSVTNAGIFVAVALVLSVYLIFEHLAAYNKPEEQKFLVGLILMVPVYGVESVKTPTLLLFGAQDLRVPVSNGIQVSERKSLALVKKLCKYLVCRNL